jgi:hypothetical protein
METGAKITKGNIHDVVIGGDAFEAKDYEGNKRFQSCLEQFRTKRLKKV